MSKFKHDEEFKCEITCLITIKPIGTFSFEYTHSSNVEPDFELKLDVYAVMMETDFTIASTPRKIKNTIHSSISRTVGKRLASTIKDELNNAKMLVQYYINSDGCAPPKRFFFRAIYLMF